MKILDDVFESVDRSRPVCDDKGVILRETDKAVLFFAFDWEEDGYRTNHNYSRPNPGTAWIPKKCCELIKTGHITPDGKNEIYRINILSTHWFESPKWVGRKSQKVDDTMKEIVESFGYKTTVESDKCFFCNGELDTKGFACSFCLGEFKGKKGLNKYA